MAGNVRQWRARDEDSQRVMSQPLAEDSQPHPGMEDETVGAEDFPEAPSQDDSWERWQRWDDWPSWHGSWRPWWSSDGWDYGWPERAHGDEGGPTTSWPSSTTSARGGRLTDEQLRNFHVADIAATTAMNGGRWSGGTPAAPQGTSTEEDLGNPRSTEKLVVPEFSGDCSDSEVGKTARSYVRKIQAWVRSTKLPPSQRALALYSALKDKAWVWFMDVEVSKISQMMTDLFRRCKRRQDQSVRDFNVEFERMVLRLHEVRCDLPPMVKAWLYLDKLRLTEVEELALLSSVGNEYDVRRLQQAALIQDKTIRKNNNFEKNTVGKFTGGSGRWAKSVHMTAGDASSEDEEDGYPIIAEEDLMDEDTAMEHHTAFMAYQGAKAKYREATRGRGTNPAALQRASEERLRLAKQRSYCSVCKRRGHWHKDAECLANQQKRQMTEHSSQSAQMCYYVHMKEVGDGTSSLRSSTSPSNSMLAIVDTACTRSVAGYHWFEKYYTMADEKGIQVQTVDHRDTFKFGASKVFESNFAVWAWFAVKGKWFAVRVAIVQCDVPLLLSRAVLAGLQMKLDVAKHQATLDALGLDCVTLSTSETGHPALEVSQFPGSKPPLLAPTAAGEICVPPFEAEEYMPRPASNGGKFLFYPKKISKVVQNFLEDKGTVSGPSFFSWWKTANQSRDFWVETPDEMIRVHVCPRKDPFDPSKWNTTLSDLKNSLMLMLSGRRITEAIPCLGEGVQVERTQDDFLIDSKEFAWHGPWIGRSRFEKRQAVSSPIPIHFTDVQSPIAMAHAQDELLAELRRHEILVHDSWSVPELRTLLVDYRKSMKRTSPRLSKAWQR